MYVSIIIPTLKKNEDYARLCINSLVEHTSFSFEILLAENGEGTNSPQGQCQAVNRAAEQAEGDWLLIVNDDMVFPYDWDKKLNFKISDCFSPNLVEPLEQGSAPPFLKLDAGNDLNFNRDKVNYFCLSNKDEKVEAGFNFPVFIKKSLWDKIGGYDENYDPWGASSDTDLQMKVELAGVTPRRNRGVLVYHFGSKSGTQDPENRPDWQKNFDYLTDKWGFNRDQLGSDTWNCRDMLPTDDNLIKYRPAWKEYHGRNDSPRFN